MSLWVERIRQRLQNPSIAPGLMLLVGIDDESPRDATEDNHACRTTREFMLDIRNFSCLCQYRLYDFSLINIYVTPTFDYSNGNVEKMA